MRAVFLTVTAFDPRVTHVTLLACVCLDVELLTVLPCEGFTTAWVCAVEGFLIVYMSPFIIQTT